MCVSPQRRAIFRHLNFKKCSEHEVFCTFWLANVRFATAACNFWTSQLQKVFRAWGVLYILTCKCAFRHSGVQFFDISTSKSAPNMTCFVHFDLQMCVSPQRRAIFRHLNFKKCSEPDVFCTFRLQNVRFATAACNFCFLRRRPTSAPAALTGLLFDWPDARIIEKTQHFATSLTFGADVASFFWLSRYCIFFQLTWLLYNCAIHLLFNSPYCRKFLLKLPSIMWPLMFYRYAPSLHIWQQMLQIDAYNKSANEYSTWIMMNQWPNREMYTKHMLHFHYCNREYVTDWTNGYTKIPHIYIDSTTHVHDAQISFNCTVLC